MNIRSQWKRLKSWDQQRWGKFTEEGWIQIDRTRRQLADSLRNLPGAEPNVAATTSGAMTGSDID